MELPVTMPSPDYTEFELLCAQIDEFEPLPSPAASNAEPESQGEEESSFDGQILAGLVTP